MNRRITKYHNNVLVGMTCRESILFDRTDEVLCEPWEFFLWIYPTHRFTLLYELLCIGVVLWGAGTRVAEIKTGRADESSAWNFFVRYSIDLIWFVHQVNIEFNRYKIDHMQMNCIEDNRCRRSTTRWGWGWDCQCLSIIWLGFMNLLRRLHSGSPANPIVQLTHLFLLSPLINETKERNCIASLHPTTYYLKCSFACRWPLCWSDYHSFVNSFWIRRSCIFVTSPIQYSCSLLLSQHSLLVNTIIASPTISILGQIIIHFNQSKTTTTTEIDWVRCLLPSDPIFILVSSLVSSAIPLGMMDFVNGRIFYLSSSIFLKRSHSSSWIRQRVNQPM